jgi:hypothetical protein
MTSREEIKQGFVDEGWELDGGFSGYLAVGEDARLSILASRQVWETASPRLSCTTGKGRSPTG